MNDLDVTFEESPWEAFLRTRRPGDSVSAANFLALLEGEEEQAVEDALADLEESCLQLDISDLPKAGGTGEAALRLRQECQLVQKGLNPGDLEPNDPLRLYLEEVDRMAVSGDEQRLAEKCAQLSQRHREGLDVSLSGLTDFTSEEMSHIAGLVQRNQGPVNEQALLDCVRTIQREYQTGKVATEADLLALRDKMKERKGIRA